MTLENYQKLTSEKYWADKKLDGAQVDLDGEQLSQFVEHPDFLSATLKRDASAGNGAGSTEHTIYYAGFDGIVRVSQIVSLRGTPEDQGKFVGQVIDRALAKVEDANEKMASLSDRLRNAELALADMIKAQTDAIKAGRYPGT